MNIANNGGKNNVAKPTTIANNDEKNNVAKPTTIANNDEKNNVAKPMNITNNDKKNNVAKPTTIANNDEKNNVAKPTTIANNDEKNNVAKPVNIANNGGKNNVAKPMTIANTDEKNNIAKPTIVESNGLLKDEIIPTYIPSKAIEVTSQKSKLLLLYTAMFGSIPWRSTPYGYNFTELDNKRSCQVNNCRVTYDKSKIFQSDALYFHGRDLPTPKELRELRKRVNNTNQIWIWLMHESPEYTYYEPEIYEGIFNWTSTYSPKSDIFIPYFGMRKLRENEPRPALGKDFSSGKDKMVLFINSHCDDLRMNFIRRLKKHVQVDTYGRCKNMINPELPECHRLSDKCRKIQSRYKFYLAMENCLCEDYITEKYYKNAMQRGLLPLVMGGANYNDARLALPHSFINIRDYDSLEQLGNYLKYLNSNNTAYNEYFKWSYEYTVELQHGMCKVCKALWENGSQNKEVKLGEFWNVSSKCLNKTTIISNLL